MKARMDKSDQSNMMLGLSAFPCNGITGKRTPFKLKRPVGATLTLGQLQDTMYNDCPSLVDRCGKFYLPRTVKMQVIGYVEGTPYPCEQLLLMTSEDKKIYGYDEEEELHLVAHSPTHLDQEGIAYPAIQSYYRGEAFKDMTNEDWEKVRQGPVGKKLDEEHLALVNKHKPTLLENLRISREKRRCHQQYGKSLPDDVLSRFVQKGGS